MKCINSSIRELKRKVDSMFKRIFLVVLDSVGIGEAPDAAAYNDQGADTVGHIAKHRGGLDLPVLDALGFNLLKPRMHSLPVEDPQGLYTKMREASAGKDTMTGHWELMGLHIDQPFQTFPNGFPDDLLAEITKRTKRDIIGNL